jgi:hypothetical protein
VKKNLNKLLVIGALLSLVACFLPWPLEPPDWMIPRAEEHNGPITICQGMSVDDTDRYYGMPFVTLHDHDFICGGYQTGAPLNAFLNIIIVTGMVMIVAYIKEGRKGKSK